MAGGKVNLQRTRVSKKYRKVLRAGYVDLCEWALFNDRPHPAALSEDARAMSELLIDFIQDAFERNKPLSHGRRAILAVQYEFRHLVKSLRGPWDSISHWQERQPVQLRVPCTRLIAYAVFCSALLRGFVTDTRNAHLWIPFGVMVRTGWTALMRPGEIVNLRGKHIVLPSALHAALTDTAILMIDRPKNRRHLGRQQVCRVDDMTSTAWLRWLLEDMYPELKIFPASGATFRALFEETCEELGVTDIGLTAGSLRPGRATHLFLEGMETSRLRVMGRWKRLESLDHYIQVASAALTHIQLASPVLCNLEAIVNRAQVFAQPPSRPWTDFLSRDSQLRSHLQWKPLRSLSRQQCGKPWLID